MLADGLQDINVVVDDLNLGNVGLGLGLAGVGAGIGLGLSGGGGPMAGVNM